MKPGQTVIYMENVPIYSHIIKYPRVVVIDRKVETREGTTEYVLESGMIVENSDCLVEEVKDAVKIFTDSLKILMKDAISQLDLNNQDEEEKEKETPYTKFHDESELKKIVEKRYGKTNEITATGPETKEDYNNIEGHIWDNPQAWG